MCVWVNFVRFYEISVGYYFIGVGLNENGLNASMESKETLCINVHEYLK